MQILVNRMPPYEVNVMKDKSETAEDFVRELRNQGIIETFGDGISVQDSNFKILYQNKKAIDIIGNHVGKYCYKAFENRDNICEGCPLALSFRDGKSRTVERCNPVAEPQLITEITASPIRDSAGKIIAGVEIVRDITKRKQLTDT